MMRPFLITDMEKQLNIDKYHGHTEGPWEQSHREGEDGMYSTDVYDTEGNTIATCAWYAIEEDGVTRTNRENNARLIADAPLLLDEVRRLRKGVKDARDTLKAILDGNEDDVWSMVGGQAYAAIDEQITDLEKLYES